VNPSTNEVIIKSNNNQFCLSIASNAIEVCPCDDGASQIWTLNDDKILSSANAECLGQVDAEVNIGNCQGQISWKTYHVSPSKFFYTFVT
jgi:hypothetical protein